MGTCVPEDGLDLVQAVSAARVLGNQTAARRRALGKRSPELGKKKQKEKTALSLWCELYDIRKVDLSPAIE